MIVFSGVIGSGATLMDPRRPSYCRTTGDPHYSLIAELDGGYMLSRCADRIALDLKSVVVAKETANAVRLKLDLPPVVERRSPERIAAELVDLRLRGRDA